MPQPIKSLKHFTLMPGALHLRPQLAAWIAVIAVQWTSIENDLAELFVALLDEDDRTALDIYLGMHDQKVRKAASHSLARSKLEPASIRTLQELHNRVEKIARKRIRIVHGFWIVSDDHPDGLILVDSVAFHQEDFAFKQAKLSDLDSTIAWQQKSIERMIKNKYTEDDFKKIGSKIYSLEIEIETFRSTMKRLPKPGRSG